MIRGSSKKRSKNKGFTLVELLIAGAVLSVLMLAFSAYLVYQQRMGINTMFKQSMSSLEVSVMEAAGSEDSVLRTERLDTAP